MEGQFEEQYEAVPIGWVFSRNDGSTKAYWPNVSGGAGALLKIKLNPGTGPDGTWLVAECRKVDKARFASYEEANQAIKYCKDGKYQPSKKRQPQPNRKFDTDENEPPNKQAKSRLNPFKGLKAGPVFRLLNNRAPSTPSPPQASARTAVGESV